jgi:hypothetical protein
VRRAEWVLPTAFGDFKKDEFMPAEICPATQFTVAEGAPNQPLVRRGGPAISKLPFRFVLGPPPFLILACRDIIPPLKVIGGDAVWAISTDHVSHQRMP